VAALKNKAISESSVARMAKKRRQRGGVSAARRKRGWRKQKREISENAAARLRLINHFWRGSAGYRNTNISRR